MQHDQVDDFTKFLVKYAWDNYFRELEHRQISAYQKKLMHYDFGEIKIAFEKHAATPKKGEYLPTPQTIVSILGFRKHRETGEPGCCFNASGMVCGRKYDFGFMRADKSYFYLCEQHYDEVREKSDVEIEMLRRAQEIKNQAKVAGMTNYEYAVATGFSKGFEKIRESTEKKDPMKKQEKPLSRLLGWASHGQKKTGN